MAQAHVTHLTLFCVRCLLTSFRLINYRHDMVFAFMRGGLLNPVVAGLSPVIHVLNPNEPLQGHLALTGDNT